MKTKTRLLIILGILIVGLTGGFLLMSREVTLTVDGKTTTVNTLGLTVRQALRSAGIQLTSYDKVEPDPNTWLSGVDTITVDRSRPVLLWVDPSGTQIQLTSAEQTARSLIPQAGIIPAEGDQVKVNGRIVGLDELLPKGEKIVLQYTPALPLIVTQEGQQKTFRFAGGTVGQALWQNGVHLFGADVLSVPFNKIIDNALELTLKKAVEIEITVDGETIRSISSAATVGQALQETGISLQNLDYSEPSEESPVPADGKIKVVRVREALEVKQQVLAFGLDSTPDPTMEIGQRVVQTQGQYGLEATRVRVRYEDGVEVSRIVEEKVVLREPVNSIETHGSKVVNHVIDTGLGSISYYRSVTVRATSYSPCRSAADRCYYQTASGAPVQMGVIAVTRAWYDLFAGAQIYVPGYGIGTVEDIGGGIPGQYWIDLGYSDSDWVNWSRSVTIYFLSPAPANIPEVLP
jgi:resuscitation-promoting factor RpfB